MSSVGFRYIIENTETKGPRENLRALFFVRSRTAGDIQSFDLNEILAVLAHDEIKEYIRLMFEELMEIMRRAFAKGLPQDRWEVSTEWDMRRGWQICMDSVNSASPRFFNSVIEVENHMIEKFRIEPSTKAFQADVHAPTIPVP